MRHLRVKGLQLSIGSSNPLTPRVYDLLVNKSTQVTVIFSEFILADLFLFT